MLLFCLSERLKALALCLSLLALCSALLAPASVLAQEAVSGKWSGLCAAAAPDSGGLEHAHQDHCSLCLLPVLALPGAARTAAAPLASAADLQARPQALRPARQSAPPSIRGPPPAL